ncbi:MAG: flagellar biosynthesis protein FlhB, partial [Mycobacterium sp.]|nr:flagellar biosynthesis protein FlhB [Mycobacterium sp.]
MAAKPSGERTEKATPRKLKKARRDGQVGHSHEIGSWLSILAASFVLPDVARTLMSDAQSTLIQAGAIIANPDITMAIRVARTSLLRGAMAVVPLTALVMATSVLSSGMQGGIHVAPKLLMPKFSRLNPLNG